jgi:hypothetical protein
VAEEREKGMAIQNIARIWPDKREKTFENVSFCKSEKKDEFPQEGR